MTANTKAIYLRKRVCSVSALFVLLSLLACGSSSSPSATGGASQPFVNPTDAQTLQAALITSTSLSQNTKFWECAVNDANNTVLRYQLVAGGRGLEIETVAPNRQVGFDWRALSATSISTQADGETTVLTFTDIQFSGRNSVRMRIASVSLILECQRRGEEEPPTPMPAPPSGNSINYAGITYPLTHAIERRFNAIPSPGDSHLGAEFKFADSEFFIIPLPLGTGGVINIWEPSGETVYLRADIYHPGTEPFTSAEFRHVADSVNDGDAAVAGVAFFNDARLGVDLNRDGVVEGDDGEFIDVVGGTITITRLGNSLSRVGMNLTLANGTAVTGFYEGTILLRSSAGV